MVHLQHHLVVTWLVPCATAAFSVHVLCSPYNYAQAVFVNRNSSSSYLSVESNGARSLKAVLLRALKVVQDAPQLGHLGEPAQLQSQRW